METCSGEVAQVVKTVNDREEREKVMAKGIRCLEYPYWSPKCQVKGSDKVEWWYVQWRLNPYPKYEEEKMVKMKQGSGICPNEQIDSHKIKIDCKYWQLAN